jgi:hypothetical protein
MGRFSQHAQRLSATVLGSLVVHLWVMVVAGLVMMSPAAPMPTELLLVAEASLIEEAVIVEEVVELPLLEAPFTDDAFSPELAEVASQVAEEIDPGAAALELEPPTWEAAADLVAAKSEAERLVIGESLGDGSAASGEGDGGDGGNPDGDEGAEFFGIQAYGRSFVFVCDSSRSMAGLKWFELQRELYRSIERLGPHKQFYIVFFDGEMHPMFEPDYRETMLLPANEAHLDQTRRWLASMNLGPNTRPLESIQHAVSLEPDVIFFLTDGEFEDRTAAFLRDVHRQRKQEGKKPIVVHTIGFFEKKHQLVLKRIAKDADGVYKFVEGPQPDRPKRRSWNVVAPPPGMPVFRGPAPVAPRGD